MDQYELMRTGHRVYGQKISELARLTGHPPQHDQEGHSRGALGILRAPASAFPYDWRIHADHRSLARTRQDSTVKAAAYGNNKCCLDPDHYLELIQ